MCHPCEVHTWRTLQHCCWLHHHHTVHMRSEDAEGLLLQYLTSAAAAAERSPKTLMPVENLLVEFYVWAMAADRPDKDQVPFGGLVPFSQCVRRATFREAVNATDGLSPFKILENARGVFCNVRARARRTGGPLPPSLTSAATQPVARPGRRRAHSLS